MKNHWAALEQGETLMGSFISTGYPVNTELMGLAGFDFVIIDGCASAAIEGAGASSTAP